MIKSSKLFGNLVQTCLKIRPNIRRSLSISEVFLDNKNNNLVNKTEKQKKVKLYPGYQLSNEELQQALQNENNKSNEDLYAKKVIEDFYGLNELEYEKDEKKIDQNEDYEEFNLETAIKFLQSENVQDIACIQIPPEINYADHMVIGNCLSEKHLNSVFITINKKYKLLKQDSEYFLKRKSSKESKWCAIDTGKIVIHLFLPEVRDYYDLECLWTCGSEFDEKYLEFREEQLDIEQKLTLLEVDEIEK